MVEASKLQCSDCGKLIADQEFLTVVNPLGGYGMPEVIICDPCRDSDKWADWRKRKGISKVHQNG